MDHVRFDPLIDSRPKMRRAGWWARQVFKHMVTMSGKYDLGGTFTSRYQDFEWLCAEWGYSDNDVVHEREGINLPLSPEASIEAGISQLFNVGLLIKRGDDWVIDGWEEFYGRRDYSTGRVQKHRAKSNGTEDASRTSGGETDETTHHTTPLTKTVSEILGASDVKNLWNEMAHPDLPRAYKVAGKRETLAKARGEEYGRAQLIAAIERMNKSDFLVGKVRRQGHENWKAHFDWFIQPLSIAKILEGKYDNRTSTPISPAAQVLSAEQIAGLYGGRDG